MNSDQVAAMRASYADVGLAETDLAADPIAQFDRWLSDVVELGLAEPNAMVVATVDQNSQPSTRHVLLKGFGADGFVFYTNYGSRKAREIATHPQVSLCFPWFAVQRQVIVTGPVRKVTREETEAYFASRPRGSQLGAWASAHQSDVVASRADLDAAYDALGDRFPADQPVPAPPFWGGYRVAAATVEFWQGPEFADARPAAVPPSGSRPRLDRRATGALVAPARTARSTGQAIACAAITRSLTSPA